MKNCEIKHQGIQILPANLYISFDNHDQIHT